MQTLSPLLATIDRKFSSYLGNGKRLVVSSSFQTHSIPLLHLVSQLAPQTPVVFLDTGYHFAETISFRDEVATQLDLNLIVVSGLEKRDPTGDGLYAVSETACCNLNKVEPMNQLLEDFDVWISGVRSNQTSLRQGLSEVRPGPSNTERYHPILRWTDQDISRYRAEHALPAHPLDELGYSSIGCAPCTKPADGDGRSGRWSSTGKTECGLQL